MIFLIYILQYVRRLFGWNTVGKDRPNILKINSAVDLIGSTGSQCYTILYPYLFFLEDLQRKMSK